MFRCFGTVVNTFTIQHEDMNGRKIHNALRIARRRRGLSRKQVARLLGYKDVSTVTRLEQGTLAPSLKIVLTLEALYRTPIAFLYPELYASIRDHLRSLEAHLPRRSKKGGANAT